MKSLKLIIAGSFLLSLFSCSQNMDSTVPAEPTEPKFLISIEDATKQLDKYKAAHPGVNGSEYALRTWVSIEDLENYIAWVKAESKKKKIDVNGIDFIYTQHKGGLPGLKNADNKDYELTFMFAPTYKDGTHNTAFDPISSKENEPAKLSELLVSKSLKDSTNTSNPSTVGDKPGPVGASGIGNNFNSCPNICP